MQKALLNRNTLKPLLKEGATDAMYQSTFLPIFQDAETRIKMLILGAFLTLSSKRALMMSIMGIIASVEEKVPKELRDRQAYIEGLKKRTRFYMAKYYNMPEIEFKRVTNRLSKIMPKSVQIPKNPQDMLELTKKISKNKDAMWSEAKAIPYIKDYEKTVYKRMDEFAQTPLTTYEEGKKPISLWQKAELDVRYNKQMEMLQNLTDQGVELAWISSHVDCSKRCEKWQGKLVSLTEHATMSGFRVKKTDGHWVYSLPDIMAQTDKYGYHNNIICGFNCRHRLTAYEPDKAKPREYTKEEVAKQRNIEENIRKIEREIRLQKTRQLFYEKLGEKKIAKQIENRVKMLTEKYKRYCERNGYAWFQYRINIREGSNKYL